MHILADTVKHSQKGYNVNPGAGMACSPVEHEGTLCFVVYIVVIVIVFLCAFSHCYALLLFLSAITAVTVMWSVAHMPLTCLYRCVCVWV